MVSYVKSQLLGIDSYVTYKCGLHDVFEFLTYNERSVYF